MENKSKDVTPTTRPITEGCTKSNENTRPEGAKPMAMAKPQGQTVSSGSAGSSQSGGSTQGGGSSQSGQSSQDASAQSSSQND
jgi:hypothetical protein